MVKRIQNMKTENKLCSLPNQFKPRQIISAHIQYVQVILPIKINSMQKRTQMHKVKVTNCQHYMYIIPVTCNQIILITANV